MAANIVRIKCKKPVGATVNFAAQSVLDSLADHGTLLARNGQKIGFFMRQDFLAKRDVEVLRGPVGVARIDIAPFQMRHPEALGEALGLAFQGLRRWLAYSSDTAINREWQAHQGIAKNPALDMTKRQHRLNTAIGFGIEKIGVVMKDFPDDLLPLRAMEERGFGTGHDKLVPPRCGRYVVRQQSPDGHL